MKVGIIEDDYQLNNAIKIILEKEGYEVVQGHSCIEGIKILDEGVDVILLDINLPDGEGFEVCHHNDKKIPILFLTARDEEIDMIHAYDSGCEDYIIKPFSMKVLIKKIEVVLRRNQKSENILIYNDLQIDVNKQKLEYEMKLLI
ncbi:MAG: response regulator transcription factor [Coprobacillaceae bacterium]